MTAMDVMYGIPHLLWTTSWQAGVMAGAIWLACRQWPRMPANLRVMLWWLVSLKFVIGLVWTQPIPLPVLPASIARPDSQIVSVGSVASVARTTDGQPPVVTPSMREHSSDDATGHIGGIVRSAAINAIVSYGLAAAAGLWLLGMLLQGALLLRQLVRTRALVARSQPVEGDAAELFDDLVARLDVGASRPRLRVSTAIATPQVTGLRRPVILLPVSALESFSTRELSLTLCHELMHVQRLDLWHGWIPSVAARLFFFHPLARFAAREYAIAREAACDARVLAFMDAPAYDYGRLLMRLGVAARQATPAAAGASPTLRTLKRRLLMLHDASPHARAFSPRWWVLAAIAAVLVIPMHPTAQQRGANEPNEHNKANETILGAQHAALGETQEALHEQVRALNDKVREENARLVRTIESQIRLSEDAARRTAEEAVLRVAEAQRRDLEAHQEAIGHQQRALIEQQAALDAEHEALSRHLDEVGRALEQEMRLLFERALTAGIATRVK